MIQVSRPKKASARFVRCMTWSGGIGKRTGTLQKTCIRILVVSQYPVTPRQADSYSSDIKKGFSRNKQEDAHEFFRFLTDSLQATALAGQPK